MKKLLFALSIAVFPFMATAQVDIGTPADLSECDANLDGYAMFDLSINDAVVLNGLSPSEYTVKYYETQDMAESDTDALPDNYYINIAANTQTIYVRVTEIMDPSNYEVSSFNIIAADGLSINNPSPLKGCATNWPDYDLSVFDLTAKNDEITNGCATCTVTFYKPNNTVISNPANFTGGSQTLNVVVQSMDGCTANTTLTLEIISLPSIPDFPDFVSCESTINLLQYDYMLQDDEVISFYLDSSDAHAGINPVPDPQNYSFGDASWLYYRVENSITGCYQISETYIYQAEGYEIFPIGASGGGVCIDYVTGEVLESSTHYSTLNPEEYTFSWFLNDVLIEGANGHFYTPLEGGTYSAIAVHNITGCTLTGSFEMYQSSPPVATENPIVVDGNSITVNVVGYGPFFYRINEGPWQETNTFVDVPAGTHIIHVSAMCFIADLYFDVTIEGPLPPTAPANQSLPEGSTLADIEIDGENIQWYDNPGIVSPPNGMDGDEPLPATTLLQDGTTYYASQTVDGIESQRTGVTVHSTLGTEDTTFNGIMTYPNPIGDVLTISNSNAIDAVAVYNMLGQVVVATTPGTAETAVDFSGITEGVYVVKIASGNKEKTIRVVKKL